MQRRLQLLSAAAAIAISAMAPGLASAQQESDDDEMVHPYRGDIDPFRGDINPFTGDINPFRGDINPFYGDISPFWGDINPFWGDINPFRGDINPFFGDINPFWGDIDPFFGQDIDPFWGDISPFLESYGLTIGQLNEDWAALLENEGDANALAVALATLLADADSVFGDVIEARTGGDINEAFLADLLDRFGIDLTDPDSLANVTAAERSEFFLALYDNLMDYTGFDHVDHWMPAIGWSPALANEHGAGLGGRVGILDFSVNQGEPGGFRARTGERGYLDFHHGAAVASLIGAPIDGVGVMGVAPDSSLFLYNPFDASLTTDWLSVRRGLRQLAQQNVQVMNMSLGVRGWTFHPEWRSVFRMRMLQRFGHRYTFVVAAGNDGVSQTTDINWTGVPILDNLIIVGSVDPMGNISNFSNRPGTACLTVSGVCQDGYRLMDRYLVAPGELILASDGEGGTVRVSGTSFAAPLVSGAAALVQGEWLWLRGRHVSEILLASARDLGAPGTDPVYGRGMLDIEAAMAPLNFQDLFVIRRNGQHVSASDVQMNRGRLRFRRTNRDYVTTFEPILDRRRDFRVSMDELTNGDTLDLAMQNAYAERYMFERADTAFNGAGFADGVRDMRMIGRRGSTDITAFAASPDMAGAGPANTLGFQAAIRMTDTTSRDHVEFGVGEGALALNGQDGFGLFADHRPETGGVNPVLGFASGGLYVAGQRELGEHTDLVYGVTSTVEENLFVMPGTGEERPAFQGVAPYQAMAVNFGLRHQIDENLRLIADFTQLHESTGLLGAQGSGPLAMEGGADTSAFTMGFDAALPLNLSLSGSATAAVTQATGFAGDFLSVEESLYATASQLSITFDGFERFNDGARFSLIQPLHVETGSLGYVSQEVIDRETGELGVVEQSWALGGDRPLYAEFLYAAPIGGDLVDVNFFARELLSGDDAGAEFGAAAAGLSVRLDF